MTKAQRSLLSSVALFFENRVFPLLFLYFAVVHVTVLWGYRVLIGSFFTSFWLDGLDRHDFNFAMFVLLRVVLVVLNTAFAFGLVNRARPDHEFDDWREVVIPVVSSGYAFFASALMYSHARINFLLVPPHLASLFNSAGILVVVCGTLLSTAAALKLRSSFSVFVESQPVVDTGVYRWMRHPMYVGHGLRLLGYCMMNGFLLYVLVSLGGVALLVYRAWMEERKLARTEPEYRDYLLGVSDGLLDRALSRGALSFAQPEGDAA